MKAVNKICQILAAAFALAALVVFFFDFAKIVAVQGTDGISGLQMAFGSKIKGLGAEIARSAKVLFCFWLAVFSLVMSIATFLSKSKVIRYILSGVSLVVAIYMLVLALSDPWKVVDVRPFTALSLEFSPYFMYAVVALFLSAIAAIAYMFIDDYIAVLASKGSKKPIAKRVIQFFKDYKSETRKIVWPSFRDVVKNTGIVLIMCLVIGALIWLVDFGLGSLLNKVW